MFEITRRNNNHQVNSYNPFREMEELERNFFGYPFNTFFSNQDLAEFKTDITDEGDHYLLEAELPGFQKEDIDLDVKDGVLTISAKHQESSSQNNGNYVCKERRYGSFARSFNLEGIQEENITASYNNGVLELNLPKKQEIIPQSHKIAIQ